MTDLTKTPRRLRRRLEVISRRLLPWSIRSDMDRTAQSLRTEIETLGHLVKAAMQSGHENALRWEHLDGHLAQMSSDLTAMVGSHLTANAASHDYLAHAQSVLAAELKPATDRLDALTRSLAPLLGDVGIRRNELRSALAWYPTWCADAPLCAEPLVSVVVPTRNRRSLLDTALASISRQTYTNWEVVVVNDGSTDDTGEFLQALSARDGRFRLVEADGLGCGGARQRGLEHARGEVIAYLDDDNLMSQGWLRAAVEVFGRRPDLWAVYGAQLREVESAEPWLLLEPFDELRLLEGNFIDIGSLAHRPIDGVSHRSDVQGLEDWDFILSVSERHLPTPLPVIASIYLSRAYGRMTFGSNHSADEERIRSSSVRRRLADTAFVERALRSIGDVSDPVSDAAQPDGTTTADVEMLLNMFRSISQRRKGPMRVLEWGRNQRAQTIRASLPDLDLHWLSVRQCVSDTFESISAAGCQESASRFDGSSADVGAVRDCLLSSSLTEVRFDGDPSSDPERYVVLPAELDIDFDVVLIEGMSARECVQQARHLLASTGLVLLHAPEPCWHDTHVEEFESWSPIGDAFWAGSTVVTDFTDVVPIRALLRGIRRTRLHGGEVSTPLRGDDGTCD